jgi:hypothetical protein
MKTNKLIYATLNAFLCRDAIREINSSRCSFLNANYSLFACGDGGGETELEAERDALRNSYRE